MEKIQENIVTADGIPLKISWQELSGAVKLLLS
jgi:hypothetical protein